MQRRYWDSSVFLGWLLPEPEQADKCRGIIDLAQKGELIIVTSAITLTEVIKLKNRPKLEFDHEKIISSFFDNEFISLRNVDPIIAEFARYLIWNHNHLRPKDSIHLASALKLKLRYLDSFDHDLTRLDGQFTDPPLRIGPPHIPYQEELDL